MVPSCLKLPCNLTVGFHTVGLWEFGCTKNRMWGFCSAWGKAHGLVYKLLWMSWPWLSVVRSWGVASVLSLCCERLTFSSQCLLLVLRREMAEVWWLRDVQWVFAWLGLGSSNAHCWLSQYHFTYGIAWPTTITYSTKCTWTRCTFEVLFAM